MMTKATDLWWAMPNLALETYVSTPLLHCTCDMYSLPSDLE